LTDTDPAGCTNLQPSVAGVNVGGVEPISVQAGFGG
jgi:hypothetical protein